MCYRIRRWHEDSAKYRQRPSQSIRNEESVSSLEIYIREKAVQKPNFPNDDIINEFMDPKKNEKHGFTRENVKNRTTFPDVLKLIVSIFILNVKKLVMDIALLIVL